MIVWSEFGVAVSVDEADGERCEQMTNFTTHYLLIIELLSF